MFVYSLFSTCWVFFLLSMMSPCAGIYSTSTLYRIFLLNTIIQENCFLSITEHAVYQLLLYVVCRYPKKSNEVKHAKIEFRTSPRYIPHILYLLRYRYWNIETTTNTIYRESYEHDVFSKTFVWVNSQIKQQKKKKNKQRGIETMF